MSLPTPFYDQDGITIYCGDNRQVLPFSKLPFDVDKPKRLGNMDA